MPWSSRITSPREVLNANARLTQARLGAKVVVNDVQNAHAVAEEIKQQGFEATSCDITVERGDAVVQAVLDAHGRIDLVGQTFHFDGSIFVKFADSVPPARKQRRNTS